MAQAALTNNIITIFRLTEHTAAAAREPQLCPRASALHPLAQPAAPPALSQQRRLYFFGALQGEQRSPALRELVPGEIVINGPESRRFRFPAREPARPTREGSGADRPGAAQPASGRDRPGEVPRPGPARSAFRFFRYDLCVCRAVSALRSRRGFASVTLTVQALSVYGYDLRFSG